MVRILYDFDITKVLNSNYSYESQRMINIDEEFECKLLKHRDVLESIHFLGGGYDSVCFIENNQHRFYIVEPANGLIVSYELIECLISFEEKRMNNLTEFDHFIGSGMSETIFRHHRNDDEFIVIGKIKNYPDIKQSKLILKYPDSSYEWKCDYIDFVPEILRFGERMMNLYSKLLPNFKNYALYPRLKEKLLEDNILRQNYGHLMGFDNLGKSFTDYME